MGDYPTPRLCCQENVLFRSAEAIGLIIGQGKSTSCFSKVGFSREERSSSEKGPRNIERAAPPSRVSSFGFTLGFCFHHDVRRKWSTKFVFDVVTKKAKILEFIRNTLVGVSSPRFSLSTPRRRVPDTKYMANLLPLIFPSRATLKLGEKQNIVYKRSVCVPKCPAPSVICCFVLLLCGRGFLSSHGRSGMG